MDLEYWNEMIISHLRMCRVIVQDYDIIIAQNLCDRIQDDGWRRMNWSLKIVIRIMTYDPYDADLFFFLYNVYYIFVHSCRAAADT